MSLFLLLLLVLKVLFLLVFFYVAMPFPYLASLLISHVCFCSSCMLFLPSFAFFPLLLLSLFSSFISVPFLRISIFLLTKILASLLGAKMWRSFTVEFSQVRGSGTTSACSFSFVSLPLGQYTEKGEVLSSMHEVGSRQAEVGK